MSVNVVLNGQTYTIPEPGDTAWGQNLTDYFVAQATGLLQKAGGTFSLTADVNFGATYGLKSKYFTSVTSGAAAAGVLRLASADSISWRVNGGGSDISLSKNTSDQLSYGGTAFLSSAGVLLAAGFPALTGDVSTSAGSLTTTIGAGKVSNAMLAGSIQLSKLENLTSSQIIVGSVANVPTAVSMTGDITISNGGVTSIGASKVLNSMLAGSIAASKLVGSDIATVGTITSGIWHGTAIGALYGGTGVDTSASTGVAKVAAGTWSVATIVNADISGTAAIAYSKLSLGTSIVNADIATSAAIAYSKLALTGSIVNADVNASAAIAYSKLALTGTIVNADISSSAAIAYSKLALTGAILNADLAGSIADTKLSTIATAGKVSDSALPSSMASKTFTGTTTFPSSSSVDSSGNAVWGGSAQVGNSLSTGVNAFNGKTTNRTASATNGGTAVTATISTAGYPGMCIVYGTNSGNSAQILFGSSNTLVINAIVGTEFVPTRTSGVQTVVTYNSGTGVLSLQNFSGADQTYGLAKLGF